MKIKRIITVLLIATFILSVPAVAANTSDLLIQEEVHNWGIKDIMKITNFSKYLDKADFENPIDPEEYGYTEGLDIITHYIEVYGSSTISTIDPSAYIVVYKLKDVNGVLRYEETVGSIESDRFYDSESGVPPIIGEPVTITEPGYYLIYKQYDAFDLSNVLVKLVASEDDLVEEPTEEVVEEEEVDKEVIEEVVVATEENKSESNVIATPTSSKVLVNGNEIEFEAYNINDNNYFKLRDLASVVSETDKKFEVSWDDENKVISLISGQNYTSVGEELQKGDGQVKEGILNKSKILKDGEEVELTAYTINDNNYFKLRDIAQAFDIGITWDDSTKTVGIDTTIGYTAE